ncbi:uncharacterized protein LOC124892466, partial [Capsicum annuum]|uniref:uncharacterized protein LOC124892466 n=1 Tax=Capsicum annuum TaxID=4072 RepID=UPI001FB0C3B2
MYVASVEKLYRNSHNALSKIFYTIAKAYSKLEFHILMEKVEAVDIKVKKYLELASYEKWARSYATVHQGWTLTSNIAESINRVLVSARDLPIYDFLEEVRLLFAKWNCKNRQQASYIFTTLIEKFNDILKENDALCTRMTVVPATEYVYMVHDKEKHFIVFLKKKKCA